jgi:hypothetical protein
MIAPFCLFKVFFMPLPFNFDFRNPDYTSVFVYRQERLKAIRANPEKIPLLRMYYRDNPAQFIIDWGCTFDPRNVERGLPAVVPFLLFERQEEWINFTLENWKLQEPMVTVKSRDMGLSWLSVGLASSMCLFNREMVIGFGSRKEEYVDKIGAPKSLFYKARMFSKMLPQEFRSGFDETRTAPHMRITYPDTGSVIVGESGDGIGRGDRSSIYFVDESAFLERPQLVEASLSQTTNCRSDISTPNGSNNPFAEKVLGENIKSFVFHWREDPRKDQDWYDKQLRILDPVTVAQEIDMNFNASVEGILIPSAWVQSAIDAHKKLEIEYAGEKTSALDPADKGKDENAQAFRNGILLEDVKSWHGSTVEDIFGTTNKAFDNCDEKGYRRLRFDSDGLGAGVRGDGRVLNETRSGKIEVIPHYGSSGVVNGDEPVFENDDSDNPRLIKEFFANYKAQSWWSLRDRFKLTHEAVTLGHDFNSADIISISSKITNLTQLTAQLSQPTYKKDGKGRVIINKAPDDSKSPNDADAVVICYAPKQEIEQAGGF